MDTHPICPVALWAQTPPDIRAYIGTREAQVQTWTSRVHTLQEQGRTLQAQLGHTSRNASRPPSSDPPQTPRARRPTGQRRRGGQPGPPGQTRTVVPEDAVDTVVVLTPKQCQACQAPLAGADPAPFRHQVMDRPPIQPVITA